MMGRKWTLNISQGLGVLRREREAGGRWVRGPEKRGGHRNKQGQDGEETSIRMSLGGRMGKIE